MKILHFNFAQPDDPEAGAGGVGVYMRTLVLQMLKDHHEIVCLSSGLSYSPYSVETDIHFGKSSLGYSSANIVNSPVIAPSYKNFFSLNAYLLSTELDHVPRIIKRKYGEVDVFHFHNIEGLTLRFFYRLRDEFQAAAFFFSAHNYNLVCPQVNLWQRESVNCNDFEGGRACVSCMPFVSADFMKKMQASYWLAADNAARPRWRRRHVLIKPPTEPWRSFDSAQQTIFEANLHQSFAAFRESNVTMMRDIFDKVIAVSERTMFVLKNHGLETRNLSVSYIGSQHVRAGSLTARRTTFQGTLRVAYMGYARKDKGLFFLLDAMQQLPIDLARKISLTIAADVGDRDDVIAQVADLVRRFADVRLINGYTAEALPSILADIDLGIVPPLWEDNLPQVAIEFAAYGVPFLSSDLGGAKEIASNTSFQFSAGSVASLAESLRGILDGRISLQDFWTATLKLRTQDAHVTDLLDQYKKARERRKSRG